MALKNWCNLQLRKSPSPTYKNLIKGDEKVLTADSGNVDPNFKIILKYQNFNFD
jgi:hypothetical protein